MSNMVCPHCGVTISERQKICSKCDEMFRSLQTSTPTEQTSPMPSPKARTSLDPLAPEPKRAVTPINGLYLIGVAIGMYIFGRLIGVSAGSDMGYLPAFFMLVVINAAYVVGVIGLYRLIASLIKRK